MRAGVTQPPVTQSTAWGEPRTPVFTAGSCCPVPARGLQVSCDPHPTALSAPVHLINAVILPVPS